MTGRTAIEDEMARQGPDARAAMDAPEAADLAASIRRTGRLVMLGMGASHAAGRIAEPAYRALGIDALALPLSEQLGQPVPLTGRTVLVTSQSGESAEVLRWLDTAGTGEAYGITLAAGSTLARRLPCLIGPGGIETAFAATRSLTVTLALHAAVLGALGADSAPVRAALAQPGTADIAPALAALAGVRGVVATGRRLVGLAEAIALGLTELSRRPCFALEGGQLRHGPMEMLGPGLGVVLFAGDDPTAPLVRDLARAVAGAGSPAVLFDASGGAAPSGAVHVAMPRAADMAAALSLLPTAQRFMLEFAAARVADVGIPLRSSKITRVE